VWELPLKKGKSGRAIKYNIEELMATGRSQKQSVAIALRVAGYKKKK